MTYAFGIYFEDDDNLGLVAAGSRWTSGGNSTLARRARVALQRRDRYGRWAEMGGGIAFSGRNSNNQVTKMVGRYVGPAERPEYMRVYVTSGRGIQPGIYEVPSKVATVAKALLGEDALKDVGVNLDVNGKTVGDILDRDIEFIAGMFKGKPTEFELDMARKNLTKAENKIIAKARLRAPAHKSYNIVDKDGNRIDKDEEPTKPDVKKPSKKAKPAKKFPLPDLSKLEPKDRSRLEFWAGPDGKRLRDNMVTDAIKADPKNYRVRTKDGLLDGNGELVEFNPTFKPEASPLPTREEDKVILGDDGFINANNVRPGEVRKDITNAQELYEHLFNGGYAEVPIELALEALAISQADSQYLGRSKNPYINTHDSRDPKFVEIASKLESLSRWQQNRLERAISLALMDEKQLDDFNAWLDNNLEEGILLTDEQLVDAHKKFRNLGVDITNVRAKGTDVFTNDNLGALRRDMPQLDDPDQPEFLAELKRLGIEFTDERVNVKELKPVQAEMDMGSVAFLEEKFADPESRKGFDSKRLVVTRDGYILDGHHRYAAAYLASLRTGEPIELNIVRLDLDLEDALKIANEWNDHAGIFRQQIGGQFEAKPRPEAPKVEAPATPKVEAPAAPAPRISMNMAPSGPQGPDGSPIEDWLDKNLTDNGELIKTQFADRLTEDKPNPAERQSPIPGSKTVVKNLLKYKESLRKGLIDSALDGDQEAFKFKYELAKRVSNLLNQIYDNYVNGHSYTKDIEIALSTSNPDEKLKAFRILPNTLVTEVDNNGIKKIVSFDAVTIGKNGAPFVIRWNKSGSSKAYQVAPDGSVNFNAREGEWGYAGGLSHSVSQEYTVTADGVFIPATAASQGAFTDKKFQALGLMSGHIFLTRWVQNQFMENARLSHTGHLYPPGNFYSKTVSKDMRDHQRSQADKAIHQNNPNADIFKVLKDMGLVNGSFVPFDKNASDNDPAGGGANSGGSGWLRRITPVNQNGNTSNPSVLDSYSPISNVTDYANTFARKTPEEKAALLAAMPEIFKDFFGGDQTRPGWDKYKNFDVQYAMLGTAYSDGMKKEEALDFLDKIITGLPELHELFGDPRGTSSNKIRQLQSLRDAIAARQWDQANNNYNRPKDFNTNSIRVLESPFAGNFKFSDWNVGRDLKRIINELPFTPSGKPAGAPDHWTENPTELEARYSPETLLEVLTDSLKNQGGKVARLPQDINGNGPIEVNPTAVYKALENKGFDTEKMLAEIYDEINGNTDNLDTLLARRSELGNLNDIIAKLVRDVGTLEDPIAFSQIGGQYDANSGILQSDLVKRGIDNVDGNPALDLRPLEPVNETYYNANRDRLLSNLPYTPQIPGRDFYTAGVADNPKIIARNFSPSGLRNALFDALQNNRTKVKLRFPNNSELEVDNSAIRDALQLQGVDINKLLSEIPGLKPEPKRLNEITIDQDADGTYHRWSAMGDDQLRDNASAVYEVYNDIDGNGYYEIGIVNGKRSDRKTFTAKLARIKKNADGNFEVWVAKKEDNFTGEFTGTPDGVYSDYTHAMYDIKTHIMADTNSRSGTTFLEGYGRQPTRSSNLTEQAVLDDRDVADQGTTIGGLNIVRPRDAEKLQVFSNIDNTVRINAANAFGVNGADFTYGLATNPNAADGSPLESMISYSKNVDGSTLETEIYSIKKVVSSGVDTYVVSLLNKADGSTQKFHFDNLDNARRVARLSIGEQGSLKIPGVYESRSTLQQELGNATVPSADFDNQSTVRTRADVTVSTDVNLPSGVQGIISVTVKKGAHPAWRRNVADADNEYVFATADIVGLDGDNYASYSVVRTGLQSWKVRKKLSPRYALGGNGHLTGDLDFYTTRHRNKADALQQLRKYLDTAFQPGVNAQDRKTLVPTDAVLNSATNAPDAINPNAPVRPASNFFGDDVFSDFVAERGQLIDLTGAVQIGGMGAGVSGARKYELNGKKYKIKFEGDDKARQESFNHALYQLVGAPVTPARLGEGIPGLRSPRGGRAVSIVVADEFEPNIVAGRANGHMPGQDLFLDRNFTVPENQKAIADIHEGALIDALLYNADIRTNAGNSFVVVRDGVRRGVRCDNGSGGIYEAIGTALEYQFINGDGASTVRSYFGDFMPNGVVKNSSDAGKFNRGLTKESLIAIGRRTILPLTDDKIDALVNGIVTKDSDKQMLSDALKRRRLQILNYLGIDPNEEPPQGTVAQAPDAIPGNVLPTIANNGYEMLPADANGVGRVRIPGTAGPDGIYKATDYDNLPADLKSKLLSGEVLPEYLPFVSHGNLDNPALVIDGAGVVRPIGKNGMTSILLRKRKADGTYEYLYIKQGSNGNLRVKQIGKNDNKLMPIVHNNSDGPNTPLDDMLASEGFAGIPIVGSKEMRLPIPGLGQDHRIIVADIGSEQISDVLSRATQNNVIRESAWKVKNRIDNAVAGPYYYDQLNAGNDRADVIAQLERWERNWTSSPSPEPSADNDGGVGGNGPTNPGGNGGNVPSGSSGSSDSDYLPLSSQTLRDNVGGVRNDPITIDVQARLADGALRITKENEDGILGHIKPTFHGHWEATLMPDQIGNLDRNGEAVKGIFANKIDAQNWLATKIYDKYGVASGALGERRPIGEVGTAGQNLYNPNATPIVAISKGYLNPSSENQRNFANRLIEHKQATPEERALFRAILTQDNLTVGEVGWVIGKLRDREDRDSAELAESRRVREEAAAANPIQPSSLQAVVQAPNTLPIFAKKLKVGQRILGKVNGNVVFTAEGENNTINVGVVGDDGKLKVYKVGRNTILGVANQPIPATAPNANAPTHPVIQQRRAQARLIQDRIKALYPNHRELANGDLVVGQRDVVQADGSRFRYEAVVHKLKSDEFVSYVRKQPIDAAGNPVGQGEAAYLTVPGHSPKAVINRLGREVMPVISARNPANGFNQRDDKQAEAINPATGLPLPSKIVDQDAQYIGDTGIEKTGNAAKDALISYVQGLVARGQAQPEIVEQIMGGNQRLFSRQQMDDIVERLEWNRQFPGTNAIPYVSKDNKTIVRVGDRVTHYDADGNPKIMENGQPRTGIVTERRPYTLNRKPNGDYEYTDQLYVQWDDTNRPHQAAARRLEVNRRVDGAAPVPAVQGPVSGRDNNPPIAPMPLPRGSQAPGQPPATQPSAPVGEVRRGVQVDANNVAGFDRVVDPSGMGHTITRGLNMTRFDKDQDDWRDNATYVHQLNDGKWHVRQQTPDGNGGHTTATVQAFDDRNEAEALAVNIVAGNNAPDQQTSDLQDIANIGNVRILVVPNGPTYEVQRDNMGTQFQDVNNQDFSDIYVILQPNGRWAVKRADGVDNRIIDQFDTRNEAEADAMDRIVGNNRPTASAPEINDSGVTQKMEQYRGQVPYPYSLRRQNDFVNLGGGDPISLRDDLANADGLNDLRGRIFQDADGKVIVQKWSRNGGALDREVAKDLDDALQRLVNHAFAMRLERDNNNNPQESSSPSSSSPTSPDGGDGGVPPTNPPAGGDGGASEGPGLDLQPGRWRQGEPPQGVVRIGGVVPKVNTFWDDDQPPTRYDVVRSDNGTKFIGRGRENPGAEAFMRVEKTANGNWKVVDPRNRRGIDTDEFPAEYGDRNVAEALAINKMAGREELNRDILNQAERNVAPAPSGMLKQEAIDLDPIVRNFVNSGRGDLVQVPGGLLATNTNGEGIASLRTPNVDGEQFIVINLRNGDQFGFSSKQEAVVELGNMLRAYQDEQGFDRVNLDATPQQAPAGGVVESRSEGMTLYNNPDGSINQIQVVAIGNGKAWQVTRNTPGQNPEVLSTYSTREDAESEARARIAQENDGNSGGNPPAGPSDGGGGGVPPTNNPPAGPATTDSESLESGNSDSGLRVGENRGPDGMVENREANGDFSADFNIGQSTFQRVRTPNRSATYYYRNIQIATIDKNSDGTFNVRTIWGAGDSDFVVARDEENALLNAQSQIWRANQDGRIEQMDRDFADGNIGDGESTGGNAPATPANNPPAGPAPVAPEVEPAQEPQGQPRVNRIQPGDRYIKQNNRLLPNKDGKYTRFDIYDARTKKLIASAETKEIADDIAAGRRDLNGKLIDYTTPLKPGIQRVPRPEGYSRNITPDSAERMFNKDFYIENLNDPNAPVVALDYDEANAQYVGQLYANKEDAKNRRNPIGEPFSNSAQIRAEDAAHSAIQKELDKRNPSAVAPTQKTADNVSRNNLGDGVFSVNNGNSEYGLAVRQSDGTWSARVHENPRDAMNNRNPIISGTYATEQEAEDAIRQTIAERQAQRNAANVLQWQSGSDGKQYLGLDGVAGVDAENGPVYGISPSPFGGWALARWDSKASKDAGAQPNSIVAQPDEEAAKNDALQQINDFLRNLTGQNPPLVNDENPTTPTNREEQLPPGTTLQDQVDAGVTTPFNPNAPLP